MTKIFSDEAWEDYQFWIREDKKALVKVTKLIKDIERDPFDGLGKPEPLIGALSGYWSRRINEKDRIIYSINANSIFLLACRTHYAK